VPLGETAKALADALKCKAVRPYNSQTLGEALAAEIAARYRVAIDPVVWTDKPLPDHLRVRIRVMDANSRELVASRDLAEIRAALLAQSREASRAVAREEPAAWRAARAQWETPEFSTWTFDALPERVLIADQAGAPVYAFPGLWSGAQGVARRLFKAPEEAAHATHRALGALLEKQLGHDLMWTERDLRALRTLGPLATTLAPVETLQQDAFQSIKTWVTDWRRILPRGADTRRNSPDESVQFTAASFAAAVENAKADLRGLVPRFVDLVREILTLRQELLVLPDSPAGAEDELAELVPRDFLARTPYLQLAHLPRYLKALKLRADRWRKNPGKDAERREQIAPYEKAIEQLKRERAAPEAIEAFRWLVEEFRVSLFAQELGTAEPVSTVKLDRALAAARGKSADPTPAALTTAKPIVAVSAGATSKKSAPLKNLGALDKLFGR
jgi:ATP-dependent helicase HrpA